MWIHSPVRKMAVLTDGLSWTEEDFRRQGFLLFISLYHSDVKILLEGKLSP